MTKVDNPKRRQPAPPPIPEELDVDNDWESVTPFGFKVTVELWRRLGTRTAPTGRSRAQVHLQSGVLLGTITQEPGAALVKEPDETAVGAYGDTWVAEQLATAARYFRQGHR